MGLFKGLFKKHFVSDEARQAAAENNRLRFHNARMQLERENALRQLEAEKRELQLKRDMAKLQQDIAEIDGYEEDDDIKPEALLMSLFSNATKANNSPLTPIAESSNLTSNAPAMGVNLSNEEIAELWNKVPKQYRKIALSMPEETLQKLIKSYMPSISDDTLARASLLIKNLK